MLTELIQCESYGSEVRNAKMTPEQFNLHRPELEGIVKRYFDNPKLRCEIRSAEVTPFSKSRVGYLGDHFVLELVVLRVGESEEDTLNFFFKILPSSIPALNEYLSGIGTFRKECRLYSDLFPRLAQFARFAPKSYLAKDDQLLVFENLKLQGYTTINCAELGIFDKAHLEQALCALAKFHCASLMVETKTGRTLPELCPGALDENCWIRRDGNPRVQELENAIEVLSELVKVVERDNPNLPDILTKLPDFIFQIYDLVKPSEVFRNVACHGDLWGSNLMFRYSTPDGPPEDCLIVDFQFARYAPPAYDVNMLIHLTTTGEFRKQHYDELIDLYYRTVRSQFIAQCLSPEEIFPEKQFRQSCGKYRISGLIDNFLMNHVTLLPRSCVDQIFSSPEEYNNFSGEDKIRMCLNVLNSDTQYRARITGIIRDLIAAL